MSMATSRSASPRTTLSIKGETVQRIYDNRVFARSGDGIGGVNAAAV